MGRPASLPIVTEVIPSVRPLPIIGWWLALQAQVAAEAGLLPADVATVMRAALRRGEVRRVTRGTYEVIAAGRPKRREPAKRPAAAVEARDVLRLTPVGDLAGRRLYADSAGGLYEVVELRLVEAAARV